MSSSRNHPSSSNITTTTPTTTTATAAKMGIRATAARSNTPEAIESTRRRNEAAEILESYEKLSWYSTARCETITQTRIHFQCVVAGIPPAQEKENVHWKEDFTPRPVMVNQQQQQQQGSSRRAGKERFSSSGSATTTAVREKSGVEGYRSPRQYQRKEKEVVGSA